MAKDLRSQKSFGSSCSQALFFGGEKGAPEIRLCSHASGYYAPINVKPEEGVSSGVSSVPRVGILIVRDVHRAGILIVRDQGCSNSLIIHEEKTKEITTVKEVWICDPIIIKFGELLV